MWYLASVPLIAAVHTAVWLKLLAEGFAAGERPTPPPEWSRWYSPRVMLLGVLSFPGVWPGVYLLVIPLRWLLRNENRTLVGLAVCNGLIWASASAYLLWVATS